MANNSKTIAESIHEAQGTGREAQFVVRNRTYDFNHKGLRAQIGAPEGPTVALIGTSITDQNSKNVQPPLTGPSRTWYTDGYATWLRILSNQRINLPVDNDFGVSGDTFQNIYDRLDTAFAVEPDYLIIEGGSNDIGSKTYEELRDIWLKIVLKVHNEGIVPVILPMPPRAGAVLTAAQIRTQHRFYVFQREYCLKNRGFLFVDYYGYWLDQTSTTSVPLANYVKADNLHPMATGAYYMGKAIWEVLQTALPLRQSVVNAYADLYNATDNPTGTLLYNTTSNRSTMAGTGGTETANASLTYTGGGTGGGLAAGWTFLRGTATSVCTVTNTKENPRTDAGRNSGERQVVQIASAGSGGADEVYNLRFTPAIADVAAGDWYYAECTIEVTGAPVNVSALELYLLETRPSNSQTAVDLGWNSSLSGVLPTVTWSGTLRTPPIQRSSDATALQVNLRARLSAAGGAASITYKVGDFVVRKVNTDLL
jgi:lysophospholipase L1-like esterase